MKKYLTLLAICLSSVLWINSASAEAVDSHVLDYISMTNTYGLTNSEVTTVMKSVGVSTETINNYILLRNYAIENTNDGNYYYLDQNNSRMFVNLTTNFIQGGFDIQKTTNNDMKLGYYMSVDLHIQVSNRDKPYYLVENGTVKKKSTASWVTYSSIASNIFNTSLFDDLEKKHYFFYETNGNIPFLFQHWANHNYDGPIEFNDNTYSIGDYLENTTLTGINSLLNELKLTYKNGFTTNDQVDKLGKVVVTFQESDLSINNFHKALFKLQYGSNDWTKDNIPIFSHYKIYGQTKEESIWQQLYEDDLNYLYDSEENEDGTIINNYIDMNLKITDTTFDYVEGALADASMTFEMNFPEDMNTLYTNWKIEFYFDNTDNGYIYVYDSLKESEWKELTKMFDDYIYYYFPSKYKYAFISSANEENKGKIYFPYNSTINGLVQLQGQYLDRETKNFGLPLSNKKYDKDDYYSYFEFDFKSSQKILSINRVIGGLEYTNYYNANFIDFFRHKILLDGLGLIDYFEKLETKEDTYFYVPIGYEVEFTSDVGSVSIITSDGYYNFDVSDELSNDYEVIAKDDNDDVSFDNSINTIFKNFDNNNIIFSHFNDLYSNIKNSKLGSYISIIIIGSILILIIKSMSK